MKKKYIQPSAEFEEIEGLGNLLDDGGSKMRPDGQGVNSDVTPEGMGSEIFDQKDPVGGDDDPNG
jgi:hypothetical protein